MGDIGYFDDDGFLFFVARKKEMLKINNFQVCPSELEAVIVEIEGVQNSCVALFSRDCDGNDLLFEVKNLAVGTVIQSYEKLQKELN